DFSRNLYD
nr:Chain B, C8-H1a [Homo sapiens]